MKPSPADLLKQRFDAARALLDTGDVNGAARAFDALGKQAPSVAAIALMQGTIATRLGFTAAALDHLDRANRLKPDDPAILRALVKAQEDAGETAPALKTFDRLIRLFPDSPEWYSEKALYLQRIGDFSGASAILRAALKKMPDQSFMYRMLTATEKLDAADPLVAEMERRLATRLLPPQDRGQLGYALAKVMADTGQHDRVFAYLDIANTAERQQQPFAYANLKSEIWSLIHAQDVADFPPRDTSMDAFRPIFLIGTPRSGTTLIERVLSAHPLVAGIGEAGLATRGISVLMGRHGSYTKLSQVKPDTVDAYRRAYERHARRQGGDAGVVVDKTINLYWIMGAIRHAMPAARFVVIHRDPRDVALSIYRNSFFAGNHRYANDLGDIARYITDFRRGVAHWKARLPERPHEVVYEEFVADPEPQTRALIAAMGLPWNDACLRPHEAGGAVKTLSLQQVRQPIYKSSAKGWMRYAEALKPFDAVWDELNGAE